LSTEKHHVFLVYDKESSEVEISDSGAISLIWGAKAIAEELGVSPRKAFYLLESGAIPARKVGNLWVADRGKLRTFFLQG
jgi:hypothetical protein